MSDHNPRDALDDIEDAEWVAEQYLNPSMFSDADAEDSGDLPGFEHLEASMFPETEDPGLMPGFMSYLPRYYDHRAAVRSAATARDAERQSRAEIPTPSNGAAEQVPQPQEQATSEQHRLSQDLRENEQHLGLQNVLPTSAGQDQAPFQEPLGEAYVNNPPVALGSFQLISDADPSHRPDAATIFGVTFEEASIENEDEWLDKILQLWVAGGGDATSEDEAIAFPEGYQLYRFTRIEPLEGAVNATTFLYGHPGHHYFKSATEFFPHWCALLGMRGVATGNCRCTYCRRPSNAPRAPSVG